MISLLLMLAQLALGAIVTLQGLALVWFGCAWLVMAWRHPPPPDVRMVWSDGQPCAVRRRRVVSRNGTGRGGGHGRGTAG